MKRRLFTFVAAVSALLSAAACALWVRSYRHADLLGGERAETADRWQRGGHASSFAGMLAVEWWVRENDPARPASHGVWAYNSRAYDASTARPPREPWHGFSYDARQWDNARPQSDGRPIAPRMTYAHSMTAPHAFVALVSALPAAAWAVGAVRRRRARVRAQQRRCPDCGYDLRATPGRCPECGRPGNVPT